MYMYIHVCVYYVLELHRVGAKILTKFCIHPLMDMYVHAYTYNMYVHIHTTCMYTVRRPVNCAEVVQELCNALGFLQCTVSGCTCTCVHVYYVYIRTCIRTYMYTCATVMALKLLCICSPIFTWYNGQVRVQSSEFITTPLSRSPTCTCIHVIFMYMYMYVLQFWLWILYCVRGISILEPLYYVDTCTCTYMYVYTFCMWPFL